MRIPYASGLVIIASVLGCSSSHTRPNPSPQPTSHPNQPVSDHAPPPPDAKQLPAGPPATENGKPPARNVASPVYVPDLINMRLESASGTLATARLKGVAIGDQTGIVRSSNPLPGTSVSEGTTVSLIFDSAGPLPKWQTIPHPKGGEKIASEPVHPLPSPAGPEPPVDGSALSDKSQRLEQALAGLQKGNLAYTTPESMKTGQTAHILARIGSGSISVTALESGMPAESGSTIAVAPTPFSPRMKMTLKSADFEITPLSSEEQFVGGETPTTWEWEISPKHSGKLRLHLAAVVELDDLSRDFTTVDRDVSVRVDPVNAAEQFANDNAKWILGGIGTGIAGLWAFWRKSKPRKVSDPPDWQRP